MRERLVATLVGVTVLAITAFGLVRAYSVSHLIEDQESEQLDRSAVLLATALGERVSTGGQVTSSFLRRQLSVGEHATYDGLGERLVEGTAPGAPDSGGNPIREVTQPVAGGGSVTLSLSSTAVEEEVADEMLRLTLAAIAAVLVAGLLGLLLARRLAGPFQELASVASDFGRGRFDVEVPRSRIHEAEEIGAGLREAQREMKVLVSRDREFAINASHRLKTPLTALRLELEDLTLWPQTHPEVAAQLAHGLRELDRLGTSVRDLLELARGQRLDAVEEIDLCALLLDTARRWSPRVAADGRELVALAPGKVGVRVPPGPISQIVDALILSLLRHGTGRISLTLAALDTHVRVQVSDQSGHRIGDDVLHAEPARAGGRRDDVSFAEAGRIADALGGLLRVEPDPPTTFTLMLAHSRPRTDPQA